MFFSVDHIKLDNNRRFLRVFSEQSTIMDIYVQVGNKVSCVVKRILDVKKLCLAQKKCIEELTKQNLSLQEKNDELQECYTILQKKVEKLDDLNKLTKQNSSLQQKNDKLQERYTILQKKVEKLDDLNKGYSDVLKDLGFDEDNSLATPHTPENTRRIQKSRNLSTLNKKKLVFDTSTDTPLPQKQQQRLSRGRSLVQRVKNKEGQSSQQKKRRSPRNADNRLKKKKTQT